MKNEQREEAKDMYFDTSLTKTEIAEKLGISRKTLLLWSRQGNWERLKTSAEHIPSVVAEKCYYLIDQCASRLLREGFGHAHVAFRDAQTIHLLATSIRKIKNRCTVNESMEMFTFFHDGLRRRDPELAELIKPQIEKFMSIRSSHSVTDHLLEGFNADGSLPFPESRTAEQTQDEKDYISLHEEFVEFLESRKQKPDSASETTMTPAQDSVPSQPSSDHVVEERSAPVITAGVTAQERENIRSRYMTAPQDTPATGEGIEPCDHVSGEQDQHPELTDKFAERFAAWNQHREEETRAKRA